MERNLSTWSHSHIQGVYKAMLTLSLRRRYGIRFSGSTVSLQMWHLPFSSKILFLAHWSHRAAAQQGSITCRAKFGIWAKPKQSNSLLCQDLLLHLPGLCTEDTPAPRARVGQQTQSCLVFKNNLVTGTATWAPPSLFVLSRPIIALRGLWKFTC